MALQQKAAALLASFPEVSTYRWSSNDDSKRFSVENPATGQKITTIQAGNAETAHAAIKASQEAFTSWSALSRQQRCEYLMRSADELQKHLHELSLLLCLENGKPLKDAVLDVFFLVGVFRYFGSISDKLPSEFFDQGNVYSAVIYEPHGVCVGILPFNWPPVHVGGKLAPCLAAGNTMILKPGEQAPLTAIRIVEILETILPKDVVQIVPGVGPEVPQALVEHPLVKMVSLTGSTQVGAKVAQVAGASLTATVLELGGKNAFVVFEDANVDAVVKDAIEGAFFNKGEACTSASRILVHKSIYQSFVDKMSAAVKKLRTGDGIEDTTHVGPVVSRERQKQVLESIEAAKKEGARLAAQGSLPSGEHVSKGYFVPPTLFADVTPEMRVATEELFGPVVCVSSFETEDEAVGVVNASDYGLFAGVYSTEFGRAMRVARRIDAGVVLVNNYYRGVLGTPFGGMKGSGYGREHWIGTLREWSRIKNIRYPSGLGPIPQWRGATETTEG
ncbi:NAD/NADP-dependent betaine aldehyde dehydrogenase [Diaporthe amygdali]|uniref:NAD/NADP-dependent betaine aldehyde dehydrogenase n=1 Tax=Phomopsis amygdali TaxID=1214568 RepID=UPI0022FE4D2A|nr:NAD/NADP-dependent betaine aldehyde dehydrogenase [Diaporthe amygdali]KAJ0115248.1 NAD/NADP-dependent betaine aldehyde dehydrogenase [Diaporthe amygdali]